MRKLMAWGFSAALLVATGASVRAAGEDEDTAMPARPAIRWSPWAARVLGIDQNPQPKPKPSQKSKKETAKKTEAISKKVPVTDDGVVARAREETAFLRRLEACDKLTEIAISNNDTVLLRRAEELNRRIWETYSQLTGQSVEPAGNFESDEAAIERLLGPETTTGSSQTAVWPSNRTPDRNLRAVAQEERP
jgi:hypothetical protein